MGEQLRDSRGMPQAGFIIEHQSSDHKWKVLRNIYSGPFSDVYVVADVATNDKYAMKCERQEGNSRPVLKLDVMVLMATKGLLGFPKFVAAGRTEVYRYCIMQLIGPDLGRLRRTRPERRFSLPTALQILNQTLQRLEDLHNCGWLCRDVKAPNFCIGIGDDESTVYILDFGFARKFIDKEGKVIPPRSAAALMGTFQYCAVSAHSHKDQCARDDLESWFYMAIELLKGPLPWANIDGHKNHKLIGEAKAAIRREPARSQFFEDVPKQFDEILTILDSLTFFDRPDYKRLADLLFEAAGDHNVSMKEPLDWQNNARMQQKAIFVGELGESHQASARLDAKDNPNESLDIEFDDVVNRDYLSYIFFVIMPYERAAGFKLDSKNAIFDIEYINPKKDLLKKKSRSLLEERTFKMLALSNEDPDHTENLYRLARGQNMMATFGKLQREIMDLHFLKTCGKKIRSYPVASYECEFNHKRSEIRFLTHKENCRYVKVCFMLEDQPRSMLSTASPPGKYIRMAVEMKFPEKESEKLKSAFIDFMNSGGLLVDFITDSLWPAIINARDNDKEQLEKSRSQNENDRDNSEMCENKKLQDNPERRANHEMRNRRCHNNGKGTPISCRSDNFGNNTRREGEDRHLSPTENLAEKYGPIVVGGSFGSKNKKKPLLLNSEIQSRPNRDSSGECREFNYFPKRYGGSRENNKRKCGNGKNDIDTIPWRV